VWVRHYLKTLIKTFGEPTTLGEPQVFLFMEKNFKGIWISKDIWLIKELSITEKVFLVEINSLDNNAGCFASNSYFSDFFNLTNGRCSQIIKALEAKKFIKIRYEYEGKKLKKGG